MHCNTLRCDGGERRLATATIRGRHEFARDERLARRLVDGEVLVLYLEADRLESVSQRAREERHAHVLLDFRLHMGYVKDD